MLTVSQIEQSVLISLKYLQNKIWKIKNWGRVQTRKEVSTKNSKIDRGGEDYYLELESMYCLQIFCLVIHSSRTYRLLKWCSCHVFITWNNVRFLSCEIRQFQVHITQDSLRSSPLEVLYGKNVLKICIKFTGEDPYQNVKQLYLQSHCGIGVRL